MRLLIRWLVLIIAACLISLTLLLFITYRGMGSPGELELNLMWGKLVLTKAAEYQFLQPWYGEMPPYWLRSLAVVWNRADVLFFWWLPLVFLAMRALILSWGRKRNPRSKFRG